LLDKEKHNQQVEILKHQNKLNENRIVYLKDMERKLKQLVFDWRKAESNEDKQALMKQMHALLFSQNQKQAADKVKKKINSKYDEVGGDIKVGIKVLMRKNHQVGEVIELRGKKAIVKLGMLPITVDIDQLVPVKDKEEEKA
jgi:DNA mismatch repair protein MutS2